MTILITGATGFIGRHVCARLTANRQAVLALMRQPERLPELRKQVELLGGDGELVHALDGDLAEEGLGLNRPLPPLAAIIHLGARFAWQLDRQSAHRTNVAGSLEIAALAHAQACRLVFVSGFMLENLAHLRRLGIDPEQPQRTDWAQVYRRAGSYEASKLEAAFRVRMLAEERASELIEVQPATVAGHSRTGALDEEQPLFQLIANLARGRLSLIPGTPRHWLPLVAVDHLAALIARAALAEHPPARLMALDPATPALQPMLALAAEVLGRRPPSRYMPLPVLAALLSIPGLPRLMNTYPEALHFIQPTRFDTSVTEAFGRQHGLTPPDISTVIQRSAGFYKARSSDAAFSGVATT